MGRRKAGVLLPPREPDFHGFALPTALGDCGLGGKLLGHGTLDEALSRLERDALLESQWEEQRAAEERLLAWESDHCASLGSPPPRVRGSERADRRLGRKSVRAYRAPMTDGDERETQRLQARRAVAGAATAAARAARRAAAVPGPEGSAPHTGAALVSLVGSGLAFLAGASFAVAATGWAVEPLGDPRWARGPRAVGGLGLGTFAGLAATYTTAIATIAWRQRVHIEGGNDERRDRPSGASPAVVAMLTSAGRVDGRAFAAAVLTAAAGDALDLVEVGDDVVAWSVEERPEAGLAERHALVVVRGVVPEPDGGRRIGRARLRPGRRFRHAVEAEAASAGLMVPVIPGLLAVSTVVLAVAAVGVGFAHRPLVLLGATIAGAGLARLLRRGSGYGYTLDGLEARAAWLAHGRFLRRTANLDDIGPGSVAIWGEHLAYAAALGAAPEATAALSTR